MDFVAAKTQHFDLAAFAWAMAKAKGDPLTANAIAAKSLMQTNPRIVGVTRAAVEGHALTAIEGYAQVSASFIGTLAPLSPFDTVLLAARRLPLRAALVSVTGRLTGAATDAGGIKPVATLELDGSALDPSKVTTIVVCTDEVLRFAPLTAIAFLNGELRVGTANATNAWWLPAAAAGAASIASSGSPLRDLAAALAAISTGNLLRPHWIVAPETAIALATYEAASGGQAFPDMTVAGGHIAGVPVLVSAEVPNDSLGPQSIVLDAASFALADEAVQLRVSRVADIRMDDAPGSGPQSMVSMFQSNSAALLCERQLASKRLRDSAAVVISGAEYAPS